MSTAPDSLALLELDSLALGYRALDALVKRAPVEVLEANLVEPGRYLILFGGGVAEVEEAFEAAVEVAGPALVDRMRLPWAHEALLRALRGACGTSPEPDTLGVVEGRTVAATLVACDRSVKEARVDLAGFRLTPGLGGRAYYVVEGVQHDVEAALEAGRAVLESAEALHRIEIVRRPHPEMVHHVLRPAPFQLGGA